MFLVYVLLPISDNRGVPFPKDVLRNIQTELVEWFGGLTAHTRTPADGIWKNDGEHEKDDIVIIEIMAPSLDEVWWQRFRRTLEERLHHCYSGARNEETLECKTNN
jgi:hypothetical protein